MRFKRNLKPEYSLKTIDIIPLVNLLLLLFIFLVISHTLVAQPSINVKLPKALTSDIIHEDNFVVTVTGEDVVYINGKIATMKELAQELEQIGIKNKSVIIKSDRRASLGRIVEVWDLCRKLGIERVNIATN